MPTYSCELVGLNRTVEVEARNRDEAMHKAHNGLTSYEQEQIEWIDPSCIAGEDPGTLSVLTDLGKWIAQKIKGE